jgi:PAS domain S-box-containing protein
MKRDPYEAAPVGYLILGRDGIIRQVNAAGVRLLGHDQERLVDQSLGQWLAAESLPAWSAFFAKLWDGSTTEPCEVMVRPDGARPLILELTGALAEDGQACLVVAFDVTKRARAAEALRFAHERLRKFVDANIVGVVIADTAGAIIEANDYYLSLVGFTREEFEQGQLDWRAITPPEWQPADERAIAALRVEGRCTPYEKEYVRRDGTRVAVFLADVMLPGPEEQIVALVLDRTEGKRVEAALRESESRLSEAQKLAQLGYWTWDVATGAVAWSDTVFEIFQLDPRSFTPHIDSILSLSPWPEDHQRDTELIRKAMASREKGYYEQRFLRPDGSVGYYQSTFQGKYDASGKLVTVVGTVLDITERKQAQAKIEAQLAELERWRDLMLGREDRVQELKREVNQLCQGMGEPVRYASQEDVGSGLPVRKPGT